MQPLRQPRRQAVRHRSLPIGVLATALGCAALLGCSPLTGPEVRALFVASQKVDCIGVGPRTCLQVRTNPNAEWGLFYNAIEGFTFEAGFFYELRVEVHRVEHPPTDGSSRRYVLERLVSKTPE